MADPQADAARDADVEAAGTASSTAATPGTAHLARDLTLIGLLIALVLAGAAVGGYLLYRALYSPSAFVEHYLGLLADGDAADALAVPGVKVDASQLQAAGLPQEASDALLRSTALTSLTDVHVVSERADGEDVAVTVTYRAGSHPGTTTFDVTRAGWIGVAPAWRFARSPLAIVDLTVHGSPSFRVNGFSIDKRQVSPAGAEANLAAPVPLLVFSPGLYSVRVDTAMSQSTGVAVLSDAPLKSTAVEIQAQPTDSFKAVVQQRVDEFLTQCATQRVLQPTGCPFGMIVQNRIEEPPTWSIVTQPAVTLEPDGEGWRIPPTPAVAHVVVDIQSLYDGSVQHVDEDVPFGVTGTITVDPDGVASIEVSAPPAD